MFELMKSTWWLLLLIAFGFRYICTRIYVAKMEKAIEAGTKPKQSTYLLGMFSHVLLEETDEPTPKIIAVQEASTILFGIFLAFVGIAAFVVFMTSAIPFMLTVLKVTIGGIVFFGLIGGFILFGFFSLFLRFLG
uniref:hypothetical protein n=1 Tax=Streptococcus pluranimalium TaxID=82348 RepID=UPI003F6913F8